MCDPVSLTVAGLSAAASLGGAYMSSNASRSAANAIADQNRSMMDAQNQGFQQRMAAGTAQTAAQTAAMEQTMADRNQAATLMRQNQSSAIQRQHDILAAENDQATQLRQTGDTAAQQLLSQTSGAALDASQAQRVQQAAALLQPSLPQGPAPSDPGGDPATKAALTRRMAEAATNIRDYGSKVAQVGSYGQPIADIGQAIAANKTGIMPAQTAEALLRSGNQVRLLPAQVQYQGVGTIGQAQDAVLQSRGQGALDAAGLSYGNATEIANLGQSDAETYAKNLAAQKTADAQYAKQVGGIVSGLGNLGLYGAGRYGATPDFLKSA